MSILVDSSVLIAGERGGVEARSVMSADTPIAVSAISIAEYWKGIERASSSRLRTRRINFYETFVAKIAVVDIDADIALTTARLWADLERDGSMIPAFDLLIAASALSRGLRLATSDVGDFGRVDGLELVLVGGSR